MSKSTSVVPSDSAGEPLESAVGSGQGRRESTLLVLGLWRARALGHAVLRRLLLEPSALLFDAGRREPFVASLPRRSWPSVQAVWQRPLSYWLEQGRAAIEEHHELGAGLLCAHDADYPQRLTQARGPAVLATRGPTAVLRRPLLAVVGTRRPTRLAAELCERLCEDLLAAGLALCSGGAVGIDAIAHRAALRESGRNVVVCATGLDQSYPPENADIFEQSLGRGLLLSQFPLRTAARGEHFVRRNPTIAGLSELTVVGQAPQRSGALHTVEAARRMGRACFVLALPAFDVHSQGGLGLVRSGKAQLLTQSAQVFELLGVGRGVGRAERPKRAQLALGEGLGGAAASPVLSLEGQLLGVLGKEGMSFDELSQEFAGQPGLRQCLLELELQGRVSRHAGERYRLSRPCAFDC